MKFSQLVSTIMFSSANANIEIPLTKTTTSEPRDWSHIESPNLEFATRFDDEDRSDKRDGVAIPLTNDQNAQYTGHLYLGGDKDIKEQGPQKLSFIFDTGSPTMWVQSTKCDHQCTGNKVEYDFKDSQFGKPMLQDGEPVVTDIQYGIGYIRGDAIHDRVCLDKDAKHCDDTMELVMLTKAKKLKNVTSSGLVGLAPSSGGEQDSPIFIDQMQAAGAVDRRMFSFYDTNYMDDGSTEGSRLLLGGYDMKYAAKGAEMRWAPLIDD